jgi:hypothetical protein
MSLGLRARIISWFFIPTVILLVAVGLLTFYAGQGKQIRVVWGAPSGSASITSMG